MLPGRYAPEFRTRNAVREPTPTQVSDAETAELSRMGVPAVLESPATQLSPPKKVQRGRRSHLWGTVAVLLAAE